MDRKIALKWARALESGEYKQVTGQLRDVNGFCCLGVLCNLHAQAHPEIAAEQLAPDLYMDEEANLPPAVAYWAGMDSTAGVFTGSFKLIVSTNPDDVDDVDIARSLIDLNDDHEWDFKRIAKVIRTHSEKL